ncbi:hypothetical protein [Haladaptatus halobius]|uniref:hypothetical protein n=1 Tax=Haladaptatus halobius TaxID=2884875 RepID=UPI001D09F4EB|nr:hypothetical protein [Haladaptatus halobius]
MPEENRSSGGPKSLALSTAEKEYLSSGTVGGYRKSRLQNRVNSKAVALPERFSRLVDDADLISKSDYLDDEIKRQLWEVLLRETTPDYIETPEKRPLQLSTKVRPQTPVQDIGRFIGGFAHDVLRFPSEVEYEELLAHVIFGFVKGVYIDTLIAGRADQNGIDVETEEILERVQSLAVNVEEHRESMSDQKENAHLHSQKWQETRNQVRREIRRILSEEELIDSPQSLRERLKERQTDEDSLHKDESEAEGDGRDFLTVEKLHEKAKSSSRDIEEKTMWHLMDAKIESDDIPGTFGATTAFQQKYNVDEFDIDEFVTQDRVLNIFTARRIPGRVGLDLWLESDSSKIKSHRWRGVDAIDIFTTIYEKNGGSSAEIAKEIGSRSQKTSLVTRIARDLAGDDQYPNREVWDQLPILQGERKEWHLTSYGEVLGYYQFDHDHWSIDAIPDSIIYQGIDELLKAKILPSKRGIRSQ